MTKQMTELRAENERLKEEIKEYSDGLDDAIERREFATKRANRHAIKTKELEALHEQLAELKAENERLKDEVQALLHNPTGQYLT